MRYIREITSGFVAVPIRWLFSAAALLVLPAFSSAMDVLLIGDVSITISTATAGQQPNSVTNTSQTMTWSTLVTDPTAKVTVQTNLASPMFTLTIQCISVVGGVTAGTKTLNGTTVYDVVTDIPADTAAGQCTLRYIGSATAAQGTGTDTHTVTYTIIAQ
jgi:hypothetical protein